MKLTKQAILELDQSLLSVGNLSGVKFAYAVARNLAKLKPEVEAIRKAQTPSQAFFKYEEERLELGRKHAKKVDGKPQVENNHFVVEDMVLFEKELEELRVKYKDTLDQTKKQEKEIKELLKEEVEIDLHMINFLFVPEDITTQQMAGILPIVREEVSLKN